MPALVRFGTQLTNWYVRLNRDRLKGVEGDDDDVETGLQVFYDVLLNVTTIMAPFTPFITEYFYQHLRKMQPSYAEAANGGGSTNPVMPGKSDSVHFLKLPSYNSSLLNEDAVEAMETLQTIVELGRNIREKRLINLKTPVKNVVVVLRNPSEATINAISGSLKNYILSELNAWELTIVPKEDEHNWVTLSLLPEFKVLGRKLGKKMKAVKTFVTNLSHADAVAALESGSLEVEGITIDTITEIVSKLSFSREGDQWEAASTPEGDVVAAIDCTQDEAILASGKARELINHIQQLRKSAGLDMKDVVEAFFEESVESTESAVSMNVSLFENKFKGSVPVPKRCAPTWSVVIAEEAVEVGGSKVVVSICRPALATKDGLSELACTYLSTVEPCTVEKGAVLTCSIDGEEMSFTEGKDFWLSAAAKMKATKGLSWL